MARRILGAFIIIHALSPLIVLVVFAGASLMTVRRIGHAAGQYRHAIGAQIDTARATFARANRGFAALGTYVSAVNGAVGGVANSVKNLATSIKVPIPAVPPIEIPGVAQFKGLVKDVAAAGAVVRNDIANVTSLATVPAQLTEITAATRSFARDVEAAAGRWVVVVVGLASFTVAVWLLGSLVRLVGEVRRGWRMLLALPVEG